MVTESLTLISSLGLSLVNWGSVWSHILFQLCLTSRERSSGIPWSNITVWRPQAAPFLDSKTNQLEEQGPITSHILYIVNHAVWNKGISGRVIDVQYIKISLKPESHILARENIP